MTTQRRAAAIATATTSKLPADRPGRGEDFGDFVRRHYGWDTAPHQAAFLADPARYRAAVAGIGGGKTEVGAFDAVRHCLRFPGIRGLIVAPSYRMLSRSTLPTFLQVASWWPGLKVELNKAEYTATFPQVRNEAGEPSLVWFQYAEDPESLRGPTVGFYWLDEGGLCKRDAWRILQGRIRQPGYPHRGWVTGTPKGRNWLYDAFVKDQDKRSPEERRRYGFHTWTSHDNPLYKDDPEFLTSLEQSYGIGTDFYRQELGAEFVTWQGLVYNVFSQDAHINRPPPGTQFLAVVAGVDWGWANPAAITVHALATDGVVWQVDEWGESRTPIGEIAAVAKQLKLKWGISRFFCDPSLPGNIWELQKAGLDAVGAFNSLSPGISNLAGRIATGRFFLDPECTETLKEFLAYSYPEDDSGNIKRDTPIDASNHYLDTARYAVAAIDGIGLEPEQPRAQIQLTTPVELS